MLCDKGELKKDQRGPSNVPKEKKCSQKFQSGPQKPSNVPKPKIGSKKVQKKSL